MSEVTIEVPETAAPPAEAPEVVVVDTGDSGGGEDLALIVGELRATVAAQADEIAALQQSAVVTEGTAETALSVALDAAVEADDAVVEAEEAAEEAEEAAEEAETEPTESDDPPEGKHWLFKSWPELRGR